MANPTQAPLHYELYRRSSIGGALVEALDTFIADRRIEPQIAIELLRHFDKVIAETLAEKVKSRLSFKGSLDTYRFCDEVWTFIVKNINFKLENQHQLTSERVKIVAMNAKKPGEV